jgi:DNA-binding FadR family transcriptional regulator
LTQGERVAARIQAGEDRTQADLEFHGAIVRATHNAFMMRLLPIISQAVETAIGSAGEGQENLAQATLRDHALLLEFFARRDGVGAEHAMAIHMAHAMDEMGLEAGQHSGPGCHS